MCLIAYCPKGEPIRRDVFIHAHAVNSDGIGIMSKHGIEKFFGKRANKRARKYAALLAQEATPYAVHWRFATHGAVGIANTHPFALPNDYGYMMHNGVIGWCGMDPVKSDTAVFAEMLDDLPETMHSKYVNYLESTIGYSNKLVIMSKSGEFTIVNEEAGDWIAGIWYSNTYSLPDYMVPRTYGYSTGYYNKATQEWISYGTRSSTDDLAYTDAEFDRYDADYYTDQNGKLVQLTAQEARVVRDSEPYLLPTPTGYRDASPPKNQAYYDEMSREEEQEAMEVDALGAWDDDESEFQSDDDYGRSIAQEVIDDDEDWVYVALPTANPARHRGHWVRRSGYEYEHARKAAAEALAKMQASEELHALARQAV